MRFLTKIVAGLDPRLLSDFLNIYLPVRSQARARDCPARCFFSEYWVARVIPHLTIH